MKAPPLVDLLRAADLLQDVTLNTDGTAPTWAAYVCTWLRRYAGRLKAAAVTNGQLTDAERARNAARAGRAGGAARAESMTPERRAEIARKAAAKRWAGKGT
jgi:hypothetical protein